MDIAEVRMIMVGVLEDTRSSCSSVHNIMTKQNNQEHARSFRSKHEDNSSFVEASFSVH